MLPIIVTIVSLTLSTLGLVPSQVIAYNRPSEVEVVERYADTLNEKISFYAQIYAINEVSIREILDCENKTFIFQVIQQ